MIEVINPGVYASIQDGGRKGLSKYGVPVSGFMDRYSAVLVNSLLNSPHEAPLIESAWSGLNLRFHQSVFIACSGASAKIYLNKMPIPLNLKIEAKEGDELKIASVEKGVWTYIGVLGELQVERVLNSFSQFNAVTSKERLHQGMYIAFQTGFGTEKSYARVKSFKNILDPLEIEVFKGPEFDLLTPTDQELLFSTRFSVSQQCNRMAYALDERITTHNYSLLTCPVLPGTVQWTPAGQLFCLMRDAQTTGGYPRILQLKESSIPILAQKQPGDYFSFSLV
jgi:biotin-dependent carboxylase-like uncharacterized protein